MFLTPQELFEMTGFKRRDAQVKELNRLGIVHKVRGDGKVLVYEKHVDKEFDGGATSVKKIKETEPNWNAIR